MFFFLIEINVAIQIKIRPLIVIHAENNRQDFIFLLHAMCAQLCPECFVLFFKIVFFSIVIPLFDFVRKRIYSSFERVEKAK